MRGFAPPPEVDQLADTLEQAYLTVVLPKRFSMSTPADITVTTVSTKGQVILPKAIRNRHRWDAGTRLIVEDTPDGVLLKAAPLFKPTRPEDVFGMLGYTGKPKSLEQMDAGIVAEVKRRHARGRY